MGIVEQCLLQLNNEKRRWRKMALILSVLSLIVALFTVWNLRMTGVTIANSATCGYEEHQHSEECPHEKLLICEVQALLEEESTEPAEESTEPAEEGAEMAEATADMPSEPAEPVHEHTEDCYHIVWQCEIEEHIHKIACYSDPAVDVETPEIWEATLPPLTGNKGEDLLLIAQSQLGYTESKRNFALDEDGVTKCGITRYGQWYGNPYGNWANMFTAFCLRYAGFPEELVNAGTDIMRKGWEDRELYRSIESYAPVPGDVAFLDKNGNGTAETTAIVVSLENGILTLIEGNVDNAVTQISYTVDGGVVVGFGVSSPENRVMMFAAAPSATASAIGSTVNYTSNLLTQGGSFIIYTTGSDGVSYALDGNGNAVPIQIDSAGSIYADVADQNTLYWVFEKTNNYDNKPAYYIQNAATGNYLHPNRDANTFGPLHPDRWETAIYTNGSGVRLRGARQDAYVQLSGTAYTVSDTQNNGSTMYFGKPPSALNLWLDGTNGNIMTCRGSDNTRYTVYSGVEAQLPSQWKSPTKYNYKLAGWVNIKTGDYYLPGSMIKITEDTVLYADWVATTYDIGQYNSSVADTISTNDFITTHVFDYSTLINLLSTKVTVNVSGTSHSESWSHVGSGAVSYKGQQTLDFSFNDHDGSGTITNLNNLNNENKYTGGTAVYSGIYNEALGDALFATDNLFDPTTGEGVIGKHYLGQGDHLFQIDTDPTSEFYGYYYYDAKLNAASYNQTDQRFYVYDYLARTSDSANNNDEGKYSDFLPLNSPYANTNGQTIKTYNYAGENGEYSGVSHYVYDARYDSDGSSASQVHCNLWFGLRVDVQFGLPDTPGEKLADGQYGNRDIYGNEMHFKFTGDDDVWILIDGKVALDLGGIHQAAEGDINFSTGEVRVNGQSAGKLSGVEPGEHTLSILYLERGSSMSNCAIYFNLAPRFSLTLEKEDVLTQEILNGAQFAFYNDRACTDPCDLWTSQQSYKNGDEPTNVFTIQRGKAYVWGLSPSRTYYIKEVAPPNADGYDPAKGVIQLTLDKNGLNSSSATIIEGAEQTVSHGFTVHGFRIDEENQAAYIVITNAQNWVTETTSVYVEKRWNDTENHTLDSVTVYLNVTDADGTVRRLREISLSEENDWKYTWMNLPKFVLDEQTMTESDIPVQYSVSEAYVPGYAPQVNKLEKGTYTEVTWAESAQFKNGEEYILKTNSGYLSAVAENQNTLKFVDEATAKNSPLALWKATVSSNMVKLTNQAGQSLTYYASGATRYFQASTGSSSNQNLTATAYGTGFRLAYKSGRTSYYLSTTLNSKGYIDAKSQANSAMTVNLMTKTVTTTTLEFDGYGYAITNTPLTTETALKVTKRWEYPGGDTTVYEKEQVTIKLLANGVDTGRTETVSLKTNWTAVFNGLPYLDDAGQPITYTVVESWGNMDWIPIYGQITSTGGEIPTYETTVTNTYRWTGSYELPSTGGIGNSLYILFGLVLVLGPFVYGFSLRRKHRKEGRT